MSKHFILIFSLLVSGSIFSQKSDTLQLDTLPYHSPTKATLLSMALPGLGQAYNKKYWKIPIVYAIIATPLYFAIDESKKYNEFRDAFVLESLDSTHKYSGIYTSTQLNSILEGHRENRDLFFILTAAAYAMNILDAAVDAHLFNFDVSDDLSATFKPTFQFDRANNTFIPAFTLSLKFAKTSQRTAY